MSPLDIGINFLLRDKKINIDSFPTLTKLKMYIKGLM